MNIKQLKKTIEAEVSVNFPLIVPKPRFEGNTKFLDNTSESWELLLKGVMRLREVVWKNLEELTTTDLWLKNEVRLQSYFHSFTFKFAQSAWETAIEGAENAERFKDTLYFLRLLTYDIGVSSETIPSIVSISQNVMDFLRVTGTYGYEYATGHFEAKKMSDNILFAIRDFGLDLQHYKGILTALIKHHAEKAVNKATKPVRLKPLILTTGTDTGKVGYINPKEFKAVLDHAGLRVENYFWESATITYGGDLLEELETRRTTRVKGMSRLMIDLAKSLNLSDVYTQWSTAIDTIAPKDKLEFANYTYELNHTQARALERELEERPYWLSMATEEDANFTLEVLTTMLGVE